MKQKKYTIEMLSHGKSYRKTVGDRNNQSQSWRMWDLTVYKREIGHNHFFTQSDKNIGKNGREKKVRTLRRKQGESNTFYTIKLMSRWKQEKTYKLLQFPVHCQEMRERMELKVEKAIALFGTSVQG